MNEIKTIELDDQLPTELTAAGQKLVVVYYSATWCAPCKKIKPVVDALSKKYPSVVFLKVDVDTCQETALSQGITAMPTFSFHKNILRVDILQGADPTTLEEKINQHIEYREETAVEETLPNYGPEDLTLYIAKNRCHCSNEGREHPFGNIFTKDNLYLESDCDAQLIIYIAFKQPVKINSLKITAPATRGPKDIKIFVNEPKTLNFTEAESQSPSQELSLKTTQLNGSLIPLEPTKFLHVNTVQIFVQNNQKLLNSTVISYLGFVGNAIGAANVGDFKRLPGKKDYSCTEIQVAYFVVSGADVSQDRTEIECILPLHCTTAVWSSVKI